MKIDEWRGQGYRKFHILEGVALGGQSGSTVDDIYRWVRHFDVGYSAITNSLNDGFKKGLVVRRGERMRYRYVITDVGRQYLADTRKRFQP